MSQTTKNSLVINAPQGEVYEAFINPKALEVWQAPDTMTARVHHFDLRVGGGYEMSLYYPDTERKAKGKTATKEDRFTARFKELIPHRKIVEGVNFDTQDPAFAGEMTMEITLEPAETGTRVTIQFTNIPVGIKPADNEAGTNSSLHKLADYLNK